MFWAYLNIYTQHFSFPPRNLSPVLYSLFQLVTIHSVPVPGPCQFLLFLLTHLPHHISGQVLSPLPPKYFLNLLSLPYEQRLCQALIISQQTNETVSLLMMCLKPDFLYPNLFFTQPTVVDLNVNMTRLPPRLSPSPVSSLTCRKKKPHNWACNANRRPPMVQLQLASPISYSCSHRKCSWNTKLFLAAKLILFSLPHMLLQGSSQLSPSPTIFMLHSLAWLLNCPLCLRITMCTILQLHSPNLL